MKCDRDYAQALLNVASTGGKIEAPAHFSPMYNVRILIVISYLVPELKECSLVLPTYVQPHGTCNFISANVRQHHLEDVK